MKSTSCAVALALSLVSGYSQGTIDFRNSTVVGTAVDRYVYTGCPGASPRLTGTSFAAGLFYVPNTTVPDTINTAIFNVDALQANRTGSYFRPATSTLAGTWLNNGGVNILTLDGVDVGQKATVQVRVWDTARYQTFAQAFAAGYGEYAWSDPWVYTAPPPGSPSSAYYLEGLRAFGFYICPEPSTIALAMLGATGLLLQRRRT